jgi:hypothetical protein
MSVLPALQSAYGRPVTSSIPFSRASISEQRPLSAIATSPAATWMALPSAALFAAQPGEE